MNNISPQSSQPDAVEGVLKAISQNLFLAVFGLLPILFIPSLFVSLQSSKVLLALTALLVSLIFFSLSVLRSGMIRTSGVAVTAAFWCVALVSICSALFSGDIYDSFIGDTFSVYSASFLLLLAGVISFMTFIGKDKVFLMRIYVLLAGSALLLGLFHIARLLFGAEVFGFGLFTAITSSPLGGWNDLAVFFGLSIILSLLALDQLPLTRPGKILFSVVVVVALLLLMAVNFFMVWIILALVSLVTLMYTLSKERFVNVATLASVSEKSVPVYPLVISTLVFVTSLFFVIGGPLLGGAVSGVTGVEYVEVRPSFSATLDVARFVYADNALLGIGPNKFADAWRLYKDPVLNETIFWATSFSSGNGYFLTQLATVGLLGVVAWAAFFGLFLWSGLSTLFRSTHRDRFWFFITSSAFVAALYLWVATMVYSPAASILLLAALFTGIYLTAASGLHKSQEKSFALISNRRTGFVLVLLTMVMIITASSLLYYSGRHYVGIYSFSSAVNTESQRPVAETEQQITAAYALVQSDTFARQLALYQVAKLNTLLSSDAEPTTEQQQLFQTAAATGIDAAQTAIRLDETEPQNWTVLGNIFSLLAIAGVEGAGERALEAYQTARLYDPVNPLYALLSAQTYVRTGDTEMAEEALTTALELKANYTDALYLLSQLKVSTGAVAEAITSARALTTFEPNNAAAFYYLGVLLSSDGQSEAAITAFRRAVAILPNYANARYFLALEYIQTGQETLAQEQLAVVQEQNPDNAEIQQLLADLAAGTLPAPAATTDAPPVEEVESGVVSEDGTVTTDSDPQTDLIVPINPLPVEEAADAPAEESE